MAGFFFADMTEVVDPDGMAEYRRGVLATVEKYGGEYLLAGGDCESLEGEWQPNFPVLIRFPSLADAKRWYRSAEYRPLRQLRLASARGSAFLVESEAGEFVRAA